MTADEREMLLEMPQVRELLREEREACAILAESAMADKGTDDPHTALRWAAEAIRARNNP